MNCHALESITLGEPPFSRGFIFDYYDGPASGLVECGPGGAVLTFRMVAWDDRQEQRIYVLQPTPAESFDQAARAARPAGEPAGPWWGPSVFPTEQDRERCFRECERILREAGPVEYVIQAEDEIPGPLRSIHRVGDGEMRERIASMLSTAGFSEDFVVSDHPFDEWVALLRTIS
jgi:hypothetical protein